MKKFAVTCTCGHDMTVDANDMDEAKMKMKEMMNQEGVDAHWADKHAEDKGSKPILEQVHMQIDQMLVESVVPTAPAM